MIPAWVIVTGDFTCLGGQDKANYALAWHLAERGGAEIHLVAHRVDEPLASHSAVTVHRVPRPLGSHFLGGPLLDRAGRSVARRIQARFPGARVIANGGSCRCSDINWAHWVHHDYAGCAAHAPFWFKVKNHIARARACRREQSLMKASRLVLANSAMTRQKLIAHLHCDPSRVHTVYLGVDPAWRPATPAERKAARHRYAQPESRPLAAFVGSLGHDHRKGFDTLWTAWQHLCADPAWDADLLVAGGGKALSRWRSEVARSGLSHRVRLLGFTENVRDVLAAADLLVSPVRYEPYGLNVHEAICCGVPALVSGTAGVAERYPAELRHLLLSDPEDAAALAERLRSWRADPQKDRDAVLRFSQTLKGRTWAHVTEHIVRLVEEAA